MSSISITELHKQLFGRKGPTEGSVIDMAEHGRAGGISSDQGFKYTDKPALTSKIDVVSATVTYIGKARPGSDTVEGTADDRWQIKKIDTTDENDQKVPVWADGNDNYDNIWDNRASLSYS